MFSINVYSLLDPDATLSFVTPLVAIKFDMVLSVLDEPFSVSIPVGDFGVAKIFYRGCPLSFYNRVTLVNLINSICCTLMKFCRWID